VFQTIFLPEPPTRQKRWGPRWPSIRPAPPWRPPLQRVCFSSSRTCASCRSWPDRRLTGGSNSSQPAVI
jgi:hypothetical protein